MHRGVSDWGAVLAAAAAPGLLAGALLAGLLFYLDPDLPFSGPTLLRAVGIYGGLLAALSVLLHLPWTWARRRRASRILPWTLFGVLALFAALDWSHASHFAYYLPPGINQRLFKAGFWLLGGALGCFYTALLHTLHRNPYGWRSRLLLVLLAAASVLAQFERREAFRAPRLSAPRRAAIDPARHPRVALVGLETATLDAVLPLAEQGRLPFFRQMLELGAAARLKTLTPTRRGALWTVLATGKYPYRHGVVGAQVYRAPMLGPGQELRILPRVLGFDAWGTLGAGARRADGRDRLALSLWEIAARLGVATGVVSWPISSPASREPRFVVSDRFFGGSIPAAPGVVWPPELAERAPLFRVAAGDSSWTLPAPAPDAVARALAGDEWRASLASYLIDQEPRLGSLMLVLPGLATVSRRYFGGFSEIQAEAVNSPAQEQAARQVTAYYVQLDRYLSDLWQLGRFDLLAVVSAYGVEGPRGWHRVRGQFSSEQQVQGRTDRGPDGLLLLLGRGMRPGSRLPEARVEDVVPTLLYAAGFPVARDLDGKVLVGAFDAAFLAANPIEFLPSYEVLPRVTGGRAPRDR